MSESEARDQKSHPREGYAEPGLTETESARLLANEHRGELRALGLDDEQTRKLADDFIAEDRGEPAEFLAWARRMIGEKNTRRR